MEETAGFDVTPVQFAILNELIDRPGEDQVTLAARVAFDAATSGSVIGRLEARGWVRRVPDMRDRRRKLLWVTPAGEAAALQMRGAAQRVQERLMAPLSDAEAVQLKALLAKLVFSPAAAADAHLSASFRVRIALQLKGLGYDYIPVHLVRGEHHDPAYTGRVGDALVPTLLTDDGVALSQSMAIIEYLDETHPSPPLLPAEPLARAQVRALAQMVACEMHPPNNLRVLNYLVQTLKVDEAGKNAWYSHWARSGLEAFERQLVLLAQQRAAQGLAPSVSCWGAAPTLADCCLVPHVFNCQRFNVPLQGLPLTMAAFAACMALPAFQQAQPSACPDYQP